MVDQKKRWFYTINPHIFKLEKSGWPEEKNPSLQKHFSKTTFLEKWLQIKWSISRLGKKQRAGFWQNQKY